jgi:hypothetical protein
MIELVGVGCLLSIAATKDTSGKSIIYVGGDVSGVQRKKEGED